MLQVPHASILSSKDLGSTPLGDGDKTLSWLRVPYQARSELGEPGEQWACRRWRADPRHVTTYYRVIITPTTGLFAL